MALRANILSHFWVEGKSIIISIEYCVWQKSAKETLVRSTCFVHCSGNHHHKHQYDKNAVLDAQSKTQWNSKRCEGRIQRIYDWNAIAHVHHDIRRLSIQSVFQCSIDNNLCYERLQDTLIDANIWLQNGLAFFWIEIWWLSKSIEVPIQSTFSKAIEVEILSMNYVLLFLFCWRWSIRCFGLTSKSKEEKNTLIDGLVFSEFSRFFRLCERLHWCNGIIRDIHAIWNVQMGQNNCRVMLLLCHWLKLW